MRWVWLSVLVIMVGMMGASAQPMQPHGFGHPMPHPSPHAMHWENKTCQYCTPESGMHVQNKTKMIEKRIHEKERIRERIMEMKIRHRVEKIRIGIQRARMMCEQAKLRYEKAREEYMKLRARGLKDPETFRYAKLYVVSGVDYIESWLEKLMVVVQNSNMGEVQKEMLMVRIQNCLTALNESKNAVNSSSTPEELKNAVLELRKTWNNIRIEIKSIVGQIAVSRLETVVDKAEDVALKLEGEIEALNTTNVAKLEQLLNDCLNKLDMARNKLNDANEKFEEMVNATDPNELYVEGRHLLRDAIHLIREAFADIREVYYEIQHLRVGKLFFGNETGEMLVVGRGSADVRMTGVAVVFANGSVTVTPASSVVSVVGFTTTEQNGTLTASGHGRIVVRGENVTITVSGYMRMFVKGRGTAKLSGEGIYKLKSSPHERMVENTFGNVTLEFGVVE